MRTSKWLVTFLFSLFVAALAAFGQESVQITAPKGATVDGERLKLAPEQRFSVADFRVKYVELNPNLITENTDEAFRHLPAGVVWNIPVKTAEQQVIVTPVQSTVEVEKVEEEPAAPTHVEETVEQPVAQIEVATIILDSDWSDQVDWQSEVLQSENDKLAQQIVDQKKTIAKLNDAVVDLQMELVAEQNKTSASVVPYVITVRIPRDPSLGEIVAEPASVVLSGVSTVFMVMLWRSKRYYKRAYNQKLRELVKEVKDKNRAAATLRRFAERKTALIPTGINPSLIEYELVGTDQYGRRMVQVPWRKEPIPENEAAAEFKSLNDAVIKESGKQENPLSEQATIKRRFWRRHQPAVQGTLVKGAS